MMLSAFSAYSDSSKMTYSAETLEGFKGRRGPGRKLIENVKIFHEDIAISCDYAIYYLDQNLAELEGNVKIYQDSLTVYSQKVIYYGNKNLAVSPGKIKIQDIETILDGDRGTYHTEKKKADFTGNVTIDDDTSRIHCDKLIHFRNDEVSYTYGNVFLWAKNENIYLSADTIENYGSAKLTYAYSSPQLFLIDSIFSSSDTASSSFSLDTMTVKAIRMEAERVPSNQIFNFFGDVEIFKKEVQGKADTIIYLPKTEITTLTGEPIIFYGDSQLSGDSISISMEGNQLNELKAVKNSFSISIEQLEFPDRKNQIEGDTISIEFQESKINGLFSRGNSKLLYYVFDDQSLPDGSNVSSAESLDILFSSDEASDLNLFKQSPGGESPSAQARPEFLTDGREQELSLPKYKWDTLRPKMLKLEYPKK